MLGIIIKQMITGSPWIFNSSDDWHWDDFVTLVYVRKIWKFVKFINYFLVCGGINYFQIQKSSKIIVTFNKIFNICMYVCIFKIVMLPRNETIFYLILLTLNIHFIIFGEAFLPVLCMFIALGLFFGLLDCLAQIELCHLNSLLVGILVCEH